MADPIASPAPASLAELCRALQDEPLFHMSLGSKELFHSNLIAWLAERFPGPMARVFAPWLGTSPGRAVVHSVRREFLHMDLALEFPGHEPLVVENKMFSVPRPAQLTRYSEAIDQNRSLGPTAARALLSPCKPAWSSDGWRHISYRELAAGLREQGGSFGDPYIEETVVRYSAMVEGISAILELAVDVSDPASTWLLGDASGALAAARLSDGCAKLRADAVAALLEARAIADGLGDRVYVKSGLTNTNPFVEVFQLSDDGPDVDRVGWQLQGNDWRLAAVLPTLLGRTLEARRARETRASELASWFDFGPLADAVPASARAGVPTERWKRFDPDFVYRSRPVPGITLAHVLDVGIEYAHRAVALGRI